MNQYDKLNSSDTAPSRQSDFHEETVEESLLRMEQLRDSITVMDVPFNKHVTFPVLLILTLGLVLIFVLAIL